MCPRSPSLAFAHGEIAADTTDTEVALDLLYGPVYHRTLHRQAPLNDRFARTVVDYVVEAMSRPAGEPA
ncbi:MAG: Tetracyclin repressor-like, C-terminal domain [Solirubrobacterales bacterium]|nr:Tetracyclin repressor-like, C-terminal domain [Solirubrobacterales bacterium]